MSNFRANSTRPKTCRSSQQPVLDSKAIARFLLLKASKSVASVVVVTVIFSTGHSAPSDLLTTCFSHRSRWYCFTFSQQSRAISPRLFVANNCRGRFHGDAGYHRLKHSITFSLSPPPPPTHSSPITNPHFQLTAGKFLIKSLRNVLAGNRVSGPCEYMLAAGKASFSRDRLLSEPSSVSDTRHRGNVLDVRSKRCADFALGRSR